MIQFTSDLFGFKEEERSLLMQVSTFDAETGEIRGEMNIDA